MEYLLKRIDRVEVAAGQGGAMVEEAVKAAFEAECGKVRQEVVRIMQANNDYLDELTLHGIRQLEDSDSFFAELYTRANLERYEFAYLDDVRGLLQSKEYQERP